MAKIFISHSLKDKEFARKLSSDLSVLGHDPWLDEWEIKVGECIPSKIENSISKTDYVIIILSPSSVKSGWVDREWKTKYWEEIERKKTLVLPVLIEDCEISPLLKTKKYADFRKNYSIGLVELMGAISPMIKKVPELEEIKSTNYSSDISTLLGKIQSRVVPLSKCITESLEIAHKVNNPSLERFCRNELTGWTKEKVDKYPDDYPTYRQVEAFISASKINLQYLGWGGISSNIFDYMRSDKENFIPTKLPIPGSVSIIESNIPTIDPQKGILTKDARLKDLLPDTNTPDIPMFIYLRADSYINVLESIRTELTKRLLDLLPKIKNEETNL